MSVLLDCSLAIESEYAYVETDALGGYDPYSSSKACAEHVVSSYYRSYYEKEKTGLATARAGNIIGGGDWSRDRLIPDAMRAWSRGGELIIRYPNAVRPWQHILDPLAGYIILAESLWDNPENFSGPWNFGPDQSKKYTVEETIKLEVI